VDDLVIHACANCCWKALVIFEGGDYVSLMTQIFRNCIELGCRNTDLHGCTDFIQNLGLDAAGAADYLEFGGNFERNAHVNHFTDNLEKLPFHC